jgi:hypothetical protein
MAKFLLFLLTLALFAASNSKHGAVAAATAEDSDLLQRQENMAEVIRVSTSPAAVAAADPATMHRLGEFMKRELGPFGIVFNVIDKMPENNVAEVRSKAEALDAAEELLIRHHRELILSNDKVGDACKQSGRCPSSS